MLARPSVVAAVGAVVVLGVVAGAAGLRLRHASDDLAAAELHVDRASAALVDGRLADAATELRAAQDRLTSVTADLHSSLALELVGTLPIADENLDALQEAVAAASVLVNGGRRVLAAAEPLQGAEGTLEVSLTDGSIPLEAVVATEREIATLIGQLAANELETEGRLLIGAVVDARREILEEVQRRRSQLGVVGRGLRLLAELAGANGDRRYLIAVANTAEMRGSGGMILSYGVLEGVDGVLDLVEFGRIDELELSDPVDAADVGVPEDYAARWAGFEPFRRWRQANLAADFTIVAPVLEEMYEQARGEPVDGVIQIDPVGLAAILEGTGPISVQELGEVRAEDLVSLVLHEAYLRYPGIEERSDVLRDVAEAAFERLVEGEVPSLRPLAEALAAAVDGRHLLFHSRSAVGREAAAGFGASGALPDDGSSELVHLTVQNLSGNKLDWFIETELRLSGSQVAGEVGELTAEVVITNTAPPGVTEPSYVYGPVDGGQVAGSYRGAVSLYLPAGTSVVGVGGDQPRDPPVEQTEGGRPVVGYTIDVPAGETRRVSFELQTAPRPSGDPYRLLLVPSPRVRPTTVVLDLSTEAGPLREEVALDRSTVVVGES